MYNDIFLIKGGVYIDIRGRLRFVNDFNMDGIKRFYCITPSNEKPVRAWQGHEKEKKYFYCMKGAFKIIILPLKQCQNNIANPEIKMFELTEENSDILVVQKGFVNGFKALKPKSELLVFSDLSVDESKNDDYRFNEKRWIDWNKI